MPFDYVGSKPPRNPGRRLKVIAIAWPPRENLVSFVPSQRRHRAELRPPWRSSFRFTDGQIQQLFDQLLPFGRIEVRILGVDHALDHQTHLEAKRVAGQSA